MGGGQLVAHATPARLLVQRYETSAEAAKTLLEVARRLNELRAKPEDAAMIIETLPIDSVYWLIERSGDWVQVRAANERQGWVRMAGHCTGACAPLLQASGFASGLVRFIGGGTPPLDFEDLLADARDFAKQIRTMDMLSRGGKAAVDATGNASLQALTAIALALKAEARMRLEQGRSPLFDELELDPAWVRDTAFTLARASLDDPRNADVLNNVAVLFDYAGESERAALARRIARDIAAGGM
jgi:hypothetical protein